MPCKCPQCWTLYEAMLALTGETYGLSPAPGHGTGLKVVEKDEGSMTDLEPGELARLQALALKRQSVKQPWDVENAA